MIDYSIYCGDYEFTPELSEYIMVTRDGLMVMSDDNELILAFYLPFVHGSHMPRRL